MFIHWLYAVYFPMFVVLIIVIAQLKKIVNQQTKKDLKNVEL